MATENSVQFNLHNVHYALLTETVGGNGEVTYSYGTPKPIPGAVTLTLDPAGENSPFYADGIVYYTSEANNGYEGDLEIAKVPEYMLVDVFGMTLGADGVITENANAEIKPVALMYQADGDKINTDYVLYKCSLGRPGIGSTTNTETKEPQTQTMSISATPRSDMKVQAHTTADASAEIKSGWYSAVYDGGNAGANITAFIINGVAGVINGTNITVTLPAETTVTALSPTIALSAGATVAPTSGTSKNFTTPQQYVVTAADTAADTTTTKTYTVTVIVEDE